MISVLALIALGIHSMGLVFCKDRWLRAWCTGCITSCLCYLLVTEAWHPAVTAATWAFYLTYGVIFVTSHFIARFVRKELEKQRAVLFAELERTQKSTTTITLATPGSFGNGGCNDEIWFYNGEPRCLNGHKLTRCDCETVVPLKKPRKRLTHAASLGLRSERSTGQAMTPKTGLQHQRSRNAKKQPRKGGKFVCKSPRKR